MIEILAATVLLSIIAAACLPIIHQASMDLDESPSSFDSARLSALADRVLAQPSVIGLDSIDELTAADALTFAWPTEFRTDDQFDLPPVTIRCLRAEDANVNRAWLMFECAGATAPRSVQLQPDREPPS